MHITPSRNIGFRLPIAIALATGAALAYPAGGTHHVFACDPVNHTWIDTVSPDRPGEPAVDTVEPFMHGTCPFGNPGEAERRAAEIARTQAGAVHHVYACDVVNHTWIDSVVSNKGTGPGPDLVEPGFRNSCPYGSPNGGFQGTASTRSIPYDDRANPLDPAHRFH